ncbi:MAG: lysophospholipid acyltransferase family protein [Alphaproteobacteria bacterium]|nr:lysophospholipid acyltransferase family protein [Alphaproteobacteria bacterium]
MLKRLLRNRAVSAALVFVLARYLALALATTRWSMHGEEHVALHIAGQPVIVAFWHERLPLMVALWRHAGPLVGRRRAYVLISRHTDGRIIGALIRRFRLDVVHGSSARNGQERGGAAGMRQMLERLVAGDYVAITPDGPRGPRRRAAGGIAQLAAISGVPVLPCAAQTTRRRTLASWDRMVVPLPFARGVIVCGPTIAVPRDGAAEALPAIEAALTEAADLADRLADRLCA